MEDPHALLCQDRPLRNKRKRLLPLYNANEVEANLLHQIRDKVFPLETLFVFGTNRAALEKVIEHLDQESKKEEQQQLSLFVNEEARQRKLLIPTYKEADRPLVEQRKLAKFEITPSDLNLLQRSGFHQYIRPNFVALCRGICYSVPAAMLDVGACRVP